MVCTSHANSEVNHEYAPLPVSNSNTENNINQQNSLTIQQIPAPPYSPSSLKGEDSFFRVTSTRKRDKPTKSQELKSLKRPCHFRKSTHNFILSNMAAADMLYLFAQPLIAIQMVAKNWRFGQFLCKTLYGFDMAFFMMCPYFIVMVSIDRLFTMYSTQKYGQSANWSFTYCGIGAIWGLFLVIFSSTFVAAGLYEK